MIGIWTRDHWWQQTALLATGPMFNIRSPSLLPLPTATHHIFQQKTNHRCPLLIWTYFQIIYLTKQIWVFEPKKLLKSEVQKGPNTSRPIRNISRHNKQHMTFHLSSSLSLTHVCVNKIAYIYIYIDTSLLSAIFTALAISYYRLALAPFSPEHPLLSLSPSSSCSCVHFMRLLFANTMHNYCNMILPKCLGWPKIHLPVHLSNSSLCHFISHRCGARRYCRFKQQRGNNKLCGLRWCRCRVQHVAIVPATWYSSSNKCRTPCIRRESTKLKSDDWWTMKAGAVIIRLIW